MSGVSCDFLFSALVLFNMFPPSVQVHPRRACFAEQGPTGFDSALMQDGIRSAFGMGA